MWVTSRSSMPMTPSTFHNRCTNAFNRPALMRPRTIITPRKAVTPNSSPGSKNSLPPCAALRARAPHPHEEKP